MLFMLNYYIFYLDIQLRDFITHPGLYPLLPSFSSLFDYSSEIWNFIMRSCLGTLGNETGNFPTNVQARTNYVFGIRNGCVWRIRFETKIEFSAFNPNESSYNQTYKRLNIQLFKPINY